MHLGNGWTISRHGLSDLLKEKIITRAPKNTTSPSQRGGAWVWIYIWKAFCCRDVDGGWLQAQEVLQSLHTLIYTSLPWEANPEGRDKGLPGCAASHWSVETWEWRSIQDGKSMVTLGSAQGYIDQKKTGTFKQADAFSVNMWFLNNYQNTRQETVWFWKYLVKAFCMFSGVTPSSVKKAEKSGLILGAGGNLAHIWACSLGSHE